MNSLRGRIAGFNRWAGSSQAGNFGLRGLGWGASAFVVVLGSWLAVRLLAGFAAPLPAPQQSVRQSPLAVAAQFAERPLMGQKTQAAGASVAGPAIQNVQLLGILSSRVARDARAIIRQEGRPVPLVLAIGDELASGVKLIAIESKQITIFSMGRESTLAFPGPTQPLVLTNKN
ncbi:MAG: type II secretion system protein N [Rhodocyclaceae bacterium]|nr:type II secretion system protein N [Rhodocyclaceae bacterium]